MGGDLVQGAALGAAFELLFKSVIDATQEVARFSSDLNRLKSTLSSIKLAIDEIENFNKSLKRQHETEEFTIRLRKGEKLITKCSKVQKWNVFMRYYYSKKLSKLEALLVNFFQINVAAHHFRETKRISVVVSNLEEQMKKIMSISVIVSNMEENMNEIITTMWNRSRISSSETVVGFEQSSNGILIEEGGSHKVELSAP